MSGDRLRDAWTLVDEVPEDAARQVVQAQAAVERLDALMRALYGLVQHYQPALAAGTDEGMLDPVREVHLLATIDGSGTSIPRVSLDQARTMVHQAAHVAVGRIDDGWEASAQHDRWARAVLAMLGYYRPGLDDVQPGRSTLDDALGAVGRVREALIPLARSNTVEALDDAPMIKAWVLKHEDERLDV